MRSRLYEKIKNLHKKEMRKKSKLPRLRSNCVYPAISKYPEKIQKFYEIFGN